MRSPCFYRDGRHCAKVEGDCLSERGRRAGRSLAGKAEEAMTDANRQKVCDTLTGPVPPWPRMARELCALAVMDTYALEPIIDEIERNAEVRGYFRAALEAYAFHSIPMLDYLGVKPQTAEKGKAVA
jgi:hypothetical protein